MIMSRKRLVFALFLFGIGLGTGFSDAQQVYVNEVLAANETNGTDPDFGAASDWIELYNPEAYPISLSGFYLTDDPQKPKKWKIPDAVSIEAGGFLLIWADDRNTRLQALHTNFKLSASGDFVGLMRPDGTLWDGLTFPKQLPDVAYGRLHDGASTWHYRTPPTPKASNNDATAFSHLPETPVLSPNGGFFEVPVTVTIQASPDAPVYFTTDGSEPTEASARYAAPVSVLQTTVIRAKIIRPDALPGEIITQTYFVGENVTLPVIALTTNPKNFFDPEIGIYVEGTNGITGNCSSKPVNWNQDWERPVHVAFYEADRKLAFSENMGVQIFGGCSRIYPQKSLALYARSVYGASRMPYAVFPNLPFTSYNNIILRSGGQDWWRTMFRDGMVHTVVRKGMDVDVMAYRPALVFLNGQYWGIHDVREKQNEHYLADHHGVDPDALDIIEGNGAVKQGSFAHFKAMMDWITTHDMKAEASLAYVKTQMDLAEYLHYTTAEIYVANGDWPGHNLSYWRPQTPDGRWRWLLYDTDFSFGGNSNGQVTSNTLAWATAPNSTQEYNPPWSTLLLRKLLENKRFRNDFVQGMAAHLQTSFAPERVIQVIDSLQAGIAAEIPRHKLRWPKSISLVKSWEEGVQIMRDFAKGRPAALRGFYEAQFGLSGSANLTLQISDGGSVRIQDLKMPEEKPLTFFKDLPIRIQAVPARGFRFAGWQGASTALTDTLSLVLQRDATLIARFEQAVANETEIFPAFSMQVFPNPAQDQVQIQFMLPKSGTVEVRVYDLLGRRVHQTTVVVQSAGYMSLHLPSAAWADGLYQVVAVYNGIPHPHRLVVRH